MTSNVYSRSSSIPHPHRLVRCGVKEKIGHVEGFTRAIRGSIRPCGKGTIGYAPIKKVSKAESEYDRNSIDTIAIEYQQVDDSTGELLDGCVRVNQKSQISPLPLPCQESQPVAVNPRVADNLTARGKKYLEDGCFLLERKYGIKNLGFYTLTLSIDNKHDNDVFNSQAATCLKRFLEKVKRHYETRGAEWLYIGVWEIHPSRTRTSGYPVLHFHYIAPCYLPGGSTFVLTSGQIRDIWTVTVEAFLGVRLKRECRIGSEICRKSSSGYLAKYYCKGNSGTLGEVPEYMPCTLSSWYSISRNLLQLVRRATIPIGRFVRDDSECSTIGNFLSVYTSQSGEVVKNIDGRDVILGYWFEINQYFHECMLVEIDAILNKHL